MSVRPATAVAAESVHDAEFLDDVLRGFSRPQRSVPGKHLWDEAGSTFFDRICDSADYYLTRRELALLREVAPQIAEAVGPDATLVELGSGSSLKVRVLLDAMDRPRRYVAIDIAEEHLEAAAARIARDYPDLEVVPVVADYTRPLSLPAAARERPTLGFFPGSTIGNFSPLEVVSFLSRVRAAVGSPSWLLVGVDATRDEGILSRAYASQDGLMTAFHGNLLVRIAQELGGELDPGGFQHEVRVLDSPRRVEAHLVARRPAACTVAGRTFPFRPGQSIHTDTSCKYEPSMFRTFAADAGWQAPDCRLDDDGQLSLHLLQA